MKTLTTYKLFRIKEGKLYPLYVNANKPTPMGEWIPAECGPRLENGKVKAKLGALAFRPGWHSGSKMYDKDGNFLGCVAVATHIGEKANPADKKPAYRADNQVWCECLIKEDNGEWQAKANAQGKVARDKCLREIPVGGYYEYKTNANMFGSWCISGEIFINRILTDEEVTAINNKFGVADLPRRK